MLVTDGRGTPIGMHLATAQQAAVRLAEQTLDSLGVARPQGRHKQRPKQLVAHRGYGSGPVRRSWRRRGMHGCIPAKRRPAPRHPKRGRPVVAGQQEYRQRWKVERTFAWLGNCRRLLNRWERHRSLYQGFFTVVLMLICINQLLK